MQEVRVIVLISEPADAQYEEHAWARLTDSVTPMLFMTNRSERCKTIVWVKLSYSHFHSRADENLSALHLHNLLFL